MENLNNFLWVEKYRPQKIDDCILPADLKKSFKDIVTSNTLPTLLLAGGAGCGKTTIARALCSEMGLDYIFINASESGNIDTLRTTIRNFATTVSLTGAKKVVILDEADYLNPTSTMPSLRGAIEEFSNNCRFILTCNFKNKIIEPIHSRCSVIDFIIPNKEKPDMAAAFLARLKYILDSEKIKYEEKILAQLILKHFPDFRRCIGELQRYAISGTIDSGILSKVDSIGIKTLVSHMKTKNFTEVRKWVAQNSDVDSASIFRKLYDNLSEFLEKSSIPSVILILSEYQYKMAFAADTEICLAACMAEIMINAKFKE